MSPSENHRHTVRRIRPSDSECGFRSGKHPLDHFFARYALRNDRTGIGLTYVLEASDLSLSESLPIVGFYTLSMALVESAKLQPAIALELPKYPMPVALIGRLAIDERAQGRGFGEQLIMDALRRVVDAADIVGCALASLLTPRTVMLRASTPSMISSPYAMTIGHTACSYPSRL